MRWILCWPRLCGFFDGPCAGRPGLMPHPVVGMGNASPRWNAAAPRFLNAPGRALRRARCWRPCCRWHAGPLRRARSGCVGLCAPGAALCAGGRVVLAGAGHGGLRDESRNVYRALTGGTLSRRAPPWPASSGGTPPPFPPEA